MYFDNVYKHKTISMHLHNIWKILHGDMLLMIGFYGVLALIIISLFGEWLVPYPPNEHSIHPVLSPPAWSASGDIAYFLGTDNLGRDIFSRLINGATSTFGGAIVIMLFVCLVGINLGIWSGSCHGFKAAFLAHIFDILLSIPSLLLAIVIIALLGPSLAHVMLAIALSLLPRVIRAIASATNDELGKEYVTAMRMDGAKTAYILRDAVLPNVAPVIVSESTRVLTMAIMEIAALGFLGLSAQSSTDEWGVMISDILDLVYSDPWMMILPGSAIFISVLLVNLLGNGIYRALAIRGQ